MVPCADVTYASEHLLLGRPLHHLAIIAALCVGPTALAQESQATESPDERSTTLWILERGSGLPVEGLVVIEGEQYPIRENGSVPLSLPIGDYEVEVIAVEHEYYEAVLSITDKQRKRVAWFLSPVDEGAEEVVVLTRTQRDEPAAQVLTVEELMDVPGSFGDPIRALQAMPGVARSSLTDGRLIVRGADGSNTAVWLDEMPVPYLFHWFIARSVVNPAVLSEVNFIPGGMPTRYGQSSQGLVDVKLKEVIENPGFHGRASVDVLDGSFAGGFHIKDWSIQLGGRYSWLGGVLTAAQFIATGANIGVAPGYADANLRVHGDLGQHNITLTYLLATDWLQFVDPDDALDASPLELPYDPNRLIDTLYHRGQFRWRTSGEWGRQTTWIVLGAESELSLLRGFGLGAEGPQFGSIKGWTTQFRHENAFSLGRWELGSGVDAEYGFHRSEDFADLSFDGSAIIGAQSEQERVWVSPWTEARYRHGKTRVSFGFRGSWYRLPSGDSFLPEPRANLQHDVSKVVSLNAFAGRFTQRPPDARLSAAWGNPDLSPVSAWQAGGGISAFWPVGVTLEANLYGSWFDKMVLRSTELSLGVLDPESAADNGVFSPDSPQTSTGTTNYNVLIPAPAFRTGTGAAVGGDIMVKLSPMKGWSGWLALTFGKSMRRDGGQWWPSDYDQPFGATLVVKKDLPKMWSIGGKFQLTSGQPFTPLEPVYDAAQGIWFGLPGEINGGRFPVFHQLDLRFEKSWRRKKSIATLYLDILNATNAKNPLAVQYEPTYREDIVSLWLPIIPSLGVEVTF